MSVQPSCSGRCLSVVGGRRGGLTSQAASVRSRLASSNSGGLRSVCPPACSSMRGISRSPLDHRSLGLRGCNHSRKAGACILFDVHQLSYVRPSRVPFTGAGEPVYDLVLSSGFLAFANHSGFLAAVEEVSDRPRCEGTGGHWSLLTSSQCDWTPIGGPASRRHHGHKRWGSRRKPVLCGLHTEPGCRRTFEGHSHPGTLH
jgi:hypothetical protein